VTALEDRLRRELRAESEQITPDTIAGLRLPPHGARGRRLLSLAYRGGERQGAPLRGWLAPVAAAIVVAALIAGSLALSDALFRVQAPGWPVGGHSRTSELPAEAAARTQAITWILHQASPAAVVSCDAQVCADLVSRGFPSSSLLPLGPASNSPLGCDLVVATATVRNQLGSRLAVYAPAVIASFGTGNARVDVGWCYPGGAKAYRDALPAALRVRKAAGAPLLTDSSIGLSVTARAQLRSGQVDPRLLLLIVAMAHSHPVHIVDFASQSPGGGPASLLRWVDLATGVRSAHLTRAAYVGWMRSFLRAQRAEYRPTWVRQVTLPDGQAVLRIGYGAPSPLR
jgi:hypothetical protein